MNSTLIFSAGFTLGLVFEFIVLLALLQLTRKKEKKNALS